MKMVKNKTLKVSDVSYLLGITAEEVKNLIRAGEFPATVKRGGIRIRSEDFFEWFEFRCYGGAA